MGDMGKLACALLVVVAGCSSSNTGSTPAQDVNDICAKITSCGFTDSTGSQETMSSCLSNHEGWIPPSGCRSAVDSSTCAQLQASNGTTSNFKQACEPPCTATPTSCSGDDIIECVSGSLFTTQCTAVCAAHSGQTYVGVCGATYQGQASTTGGPVCWCK